MIQVGQLYVYGNKFAERIIEIRDGLVHSTVVHLLEPGSDLEQYETLIATAATYQDWVDKGKAVLQNPIRRRNNL